MDSITLKKLSGGPRDCISTDGVLARIKKHKRILERHIIVKCSGSVFLQMSPLSMQPAARWQPGCGHLLHQCRTLQERAPAAPAAVLLLPTLNLIQNLQI